MGREMVYPGVPMNVQLINTVLLAEDYEKLVQWYIDTLELEVKLKMEGDYHYTDLARDGKLIVGICPASEMDHAPTMPRNNSAILQVSVSDIDTLFRKVKENGGMDIFGPSVDKNEGFKFGGFKDPEGNMVWVMENFDFT